MLPKTLFRLGLSFLFIAVATYFAAGHWLNSRIFTPLNYPVSLDARQLESPPFQMNLNETYFASLNLDDSADDWYQDNRCNYKTILYPQWRVYKLGSNPGQPRELWVSSEELIRQDYYSNAFLASPGQYQLEWDIPAAASCLNPRHPRLLVITDSSGYRQAVALTQLFCIFLGGTGLALVALATVRFMQHTVLPTAAPRIFPDMVLRNVLPFKRPAPILPIHDLPHWGLFYGAVLWILMFIFMILRPLPPHGLFVSIGNREFLSGEKSPWPETLAVYVRKPSRFFVNGEEVERSSLRPKLLDHLSRRAPWTVYFEADSDTTYMDAVYAIDTIQACGAKLIWITPRMREEWHHKEQSAQRIQ
jgi:biopolymer transport protein ExbD